MAKKKDSKKDQWDLEAPFDRPSSIDELIEAQPFTEAGGADSVTAGTRIPKWLFRRAAKLTEVKGSPYELVTDVYRDAVYLGLRIIFMRYKTTHDWGVESKLANIAIDTEVMKRARSQIDTLASGLDSLMKEDEVEKAAEKLGEYVSAVVEMEDDWVKSRLFKMLRGNKVVVEIARHCTSEVRKLVDTMGIKERNVTK